MRKQSLLIVVASLAAVVLGISKSYAADDLDARLEAAEPYLALNFFPKFLNHSTVPNWIAETPSFWIDMKTPDGHEFRLINAETGEQKPAFDHKAMASALGAAANVELNAAQLPIISLTFHPDMASVIVLANGQPFRCDLPVKACQALSTGDGGAKPSRMSTAPGGQNMVYLKDNNLWLRRMADGTESQLTQDGITQFSYGDVDGYMDFLRLARRRYGLPEMFANVAWAPDGQRLLALRQDLRTVSEKPLMTEYLPPEGGYGVSYSVRVGSAIEDQRPPSALTYIDTKSGEAMSVAIDPQALNDYALLYMMGGLVWWPDDGKEAYIITANRGGKTYRLTRIDLESGATKDVISESSDFALRLNPYDYARPNVHVMASGKEAIWYSEADGHGHLYLYDLPTGKMKRQITKGDWVVADLLRVDEDSRTIYVTATGREEGRNPYYRHLYRINIDTGAIKLLTPEDADHDFKALYPAVAGLNSPPMSSLSPDGRYFVDSYSTVDFPPVMVVRDASGGLVTKVMEGDVSALDAMGVLPPEQVVAKAADGITDLYGLIYKPFDFDPSKSYPIVDITYPGPQGRWVPLAYRESVSPGWNAHALAKMGFVVVMVDGRGTSYRSREFQTAFLGSEDALGAADQRAAIISLAATRPWMDLDRVGVTGASFGGYGSLRDMLLYPDFFKVGVSIAGPQDFSHLTQAVTAERYFGDPSRSAEAREYYRSASNTALAERLEGKLLLAYGMVDENVPIKHGAEIIDALIKADKDFDLIIMPDASHGISSEPYVTKRMLAFFGRHLGGPEPRD